VDANEATTCSLARERAKRLRQRLLVGEFKDEDKALGDDGLVPSRTSGGNRHWVPLSKDYQLNDTIDACLYPRFHGEAPSVVTVNHHEFGRAVIRLCACHIPATENGCRAFTYVPLASNVAGREQPVLRHVPFFGDDEAIDQLSEVYILRIRRKLGRVRQAEAAARGSFFAVLRCLNEFGPSAIPRVVELVGSKALVPLFRERRMGAYRSTPARAACDAGVFVASEGGVTAAMWGAVFATGATGKLLPVTEGFESNLSRTLTVLRGASLCPVCPTAFSLASHKFKPTVVEPVVPSSSSSAAVEAAASSTTTTNGLAADDHSLGGAEGEQSTPGVDYHWHAQAQVLAPMAAQFCHVCGMYACPEHGAPLASPDVLSQKELLRTTMVPKGIQREWMLRIHLASSEAIHPTLKALEAASPCGFVGQPSAGRKESFPPPPVHPFSSLPADTQRSKLFGPGGPYEAPFRGCGARCFALKAVPPGALCPPPHHTIYRKGRTDSRGRAVRLPWESGFGGSFAEATLDSPPPTPARRRGSTLGTDETDPAEANDTRPSKRYKGLEQADFQCSTTDLSWSSGGIPAKALALLEGVALEAWGEEVMKQYAPMVDGYAQGWIVPTGVGRFSVADLLSGAASLDRALWHAAVSLLPNPVSPTFATKGATDDALMAEAACTAARVGHAGAESMMGGSALGGSQSTFHSASHQYRLRLMEVASKSAVYWREQAPSALFRGAKVSSPTQRLQVILPPTVHRLFAVFNGCCCRMAHALGVPCVDVGFAAHECGLSVWCSETLFPGIDPLPTNAGNPLSGGILKPGFDRVSLDPALSAVVPVDFKWRDPRMDELARSLKPVTMVPLLAFGTAPDMRKARTRQGARRKAHLRARQTRRVAPSERRCSCQGPCGVDCPCSVHGNFCGRHCLCAYDCSNRWFGCDCRKGCRSKQCPCTAGDRECDVSLCGCACSNTVDTGRAWPLGEYEREHLELPSAPKGVSLLVDPVVRAHALHLRWGSFAEQDEEHSKRMDILDGAEDDASGEDGLTPRPSPTEQLSVTDDGASDAVAVSGRAYRRGTLSTDSGEVSSLVPFCDKWDPLSILTEWRFLPTLGEQRRRRREIIDRLCGNASMQARDTCRVLAAPSTIPEAGYGLFAVEDVERMDLVQEYVGEVVSQMEAERRGSIYDTLNRSYLFDLNDEFSVDATRKGNKMRFANHHKQPNCFARKLVVDGTHRIGIFAKERIRSHQELFFDYHYEREIEHAGRRQSAANVAWLRDRRMAGKVVTSRHRAKLPVPG
jgi:hypothetical protein